MLKQFCRSKFWSLLIGETEKRRNIKEQVYSGCLYLVYTIHVDQPFAHVCIKFQLCRTHRKVWQKIMFWNWWENKWRNKNKHQPDSSTHDTSTYCSCVDQVLTLCATQSLRKEMKVFDIWKLERKKGEEIKGRISMRNLVLFHMKQQMIQNTCTKLQNPMCNSSWEIFVTNFRMY